MELNNKDIQRIRTMSYFVEAVHQIIEVEGIEAVTVRKVSKLAGYNPATLYNYFDNLDYLVGFACIKYMQDYHQVLKEQVEPIKPPRDRFLAIWEQFCYYSFERPKIYEALFFKTPRYSLCEFFELYFKMFPEELNDHTIDIQAMLKGCSLPTRNMSVLVPVIEAAGLQIPQADLILLNEMMIAMFRGKLSECIWSHWDEDRRNRETKKLVRFIDWLLDQAGA